MAIAHIEVSTMTGTQPCPVCDGVGRKQLYRTRDRHYRIPGEWTIAACSGCGLVQIDPMLTTEQLMALYPSDFYAFQDVATRQSGRLADLKRFLFPSLYVKDPSFESPGRVLDSGCGTGWALLKLRDQGWECTGVEPSAAAAKFGRERYQLDIRAGTVHSARFDEQSFDYIRSNHSLEHDPEAGATIAEFRRLLKKTGRLLIGVPNIDSLPARIYGKYWWYLGAPVHTYNFTVKHLTRLLQRHGFAIESVRYCGNYGGIIGSLQIYRNRHRPELASSDGRMINSGLCRVAGQAISAVLNLLHQGDAIEIVARIDADRR
jgi:SAM-dependent methyltransferase